MILKWTEQFSVGHDLMDMHHKKIFELANELQDAIARGEGAEVKQQFLEDLSVYISIHFAAEEDLLEEIGYPYLAQHKQQHDEIRETLQSHIENPLLISHQLLSFLTNWLFEHIGQSDKVYSNYLGSSGGATIYEINE